MKSIITIFCLLFFSFEAISQNPTNEIVISEIMADPSPSRGLPELEYLELYNNADKDLSLKNYKLTIGTTEFSLPEKKFKNGSYLLVCKKGNELQLNQFGELLTLPSMSLNNLGTILTIRDSQKRLVFEIQYTSKWYTKSKDQGYSLEMIDINAACLESQNWGSSISSNGGTPGLLNSISGIANDTTKPDLLGFKIIANKLSVAFSENMDYESLIRLENYSILNSPIKINSIRVSNRKNIDIELSDSLAKDSILELLLNNLSDCSFNVMDSKKIEVGTLRKLEKSELIISEVLFNPRNDGADFIEIINNTNRILNLKDCRISNIGSNNKLGVPIYITNKNHFLRPGQLVVLTTNKLNIQNNYPKSIGREFLEMETFPSYPNQKGTVILLNPLLEFIDSLYYHENMHSSILKSFEGVSLERIIESKNQVLQSSSGNENFASPGYLISKKEFENKDFWLKEDVFFPNQVSKNSTLEINYNLKSNSNLVSIQILDINGKMLTNIASNLFISQFGTIEWDGRNITGEILPTGYYIILIKKLSENQISSYFLKSVLVNSN